MFAPKVAKPLGKAAGSTTGSLMFRQSMRVQDRPGHDPAGSARGEQMIGLVGFVWRGVGFQQDPSVSS